jgi:hypothetical protein
MKIKIYILTVISVLTLSCGDDFYDVKPTDRLSNLTFYKNEQDFLAAVNAVYPYLEGASTPNNSNNNQGGIIDDESMSDNAYNNRNWTGHYRIGNGSHSASDFQPGVTGSLLVWFPRYEGIRRANAVINRITEISFTDEALKKRIVSEGFYAPICISTSRLNLVMYRWLPASSRYLRAQMSNRIPGKKLWISRYPSLRLL